MYKFIYRLYIRLEGNFSKKSIIIRAYRRLAEKILTIFFVLNPFKPKLLPRTNGEALTVSITTFPARIDKVWLVIESILYQSQKPDKILLWLYKGEFGPKESLPSRLLALEERGLEINFCDENLMPHKKYYYTMREHPSSNVITIDDDMFYPPDLISTLLDEHAKHPDSILCPITREIIFNNNSKIEIYDDWPKVTINTHSSYKYLTMGGGGTFFPAGSLHDEVYCIEKINRMALKTDDLWLKVMSLLNGTRVKSLAGNFNYTYLPIFHENTQELMDVNIEGGNNDKVFEELLREYNIDLKDYIAKLTLIALDYSIINQLSIF